MEDDDSNTLIVYKPAQTPQASNRTNREDSEADGLNLRATHFANVKMQGNVLIVKRYE